MGINVDLFLQTLPIMAKGLVGIFVVTGIIILSIYILNKATSRTKKDKNKDDAIYMPVIAACP